MRNEPAVREPSNKGERTREEILEAARRVIGRKGLLATTITDIAEEAGRAPATLYLYFPSKLELAYELARQFDSDATRPVPDGSAQRVADEAPEDVRATIRRAVQQFWQTFADQLPVAVGAYQLAMVEPKFAPEWAAVRRTVTQRFVRAIERLQRQGQCAAFDPVPVASAIAGMLFHMAVCTQYLGEGHGDSDEIIIETLTDIWLRAVSGMSASIPRSLG